MTKEETFIKRYDKLKKCTLPYLFWDEERQTSEYVWFDKTNPQISNNLEYAFDILAFTDLYYSYSVSKKHSHSHSFDVVLRDLYNFPESFKISKKDEKYYSKQELEYIRRVKKYLLFIGLKDIDINKEIPMDRYYNETVSKYSNCRIITINDLAKKKIKEGKLDFLCWNYFKGFKSEEYSKGLYQALLVDKKDNFLYKVEFTKGSLKKYKDIKRIIKLKNKKDNSFVIIRTFRILERF